MRGAPEGPWMSTAVCKRREGVPGCTQGANKDATWYTAAG